MQRIALAPRHVFVTCVRPRTRIVTTRADASYYVGQGIVMFTMFYCTLNWAYYRRIRIEQEKRDKK